MQTLTPDQSRLLQAMRKAPLPLRFLARDVVHLVAGLAAQVNVELGAAMVKAIGKAVSPTKLGRYLALMVDIDDKRLRLERDFKKGVNKSIYSIIDRAEAPDVIEMLIAESDRQEAQVEKWLRLPPSKAGPAIQAEHNRQARRERDERKAVDRQEQIDLDARLRAEERAQLKAAAEAEKDCVQVWGGKSHMNQDDAIRVLERVNFGGKVIAQASNRYVLLWLLPADPMKAHQDLLILKERAREHDVALALDGLPIEVLLGKRLGPNASRDPRDYQDYSARAAYRNFNSESIQNAEAVARRGKWNPFEQ